MMDKRDSTRNNYYAVWRSFNEFYIKLDVKPTSWEDRLILFIGHLIQRNLKSSTIKSYISAIKAVLKQDGIMLNENRCLITSLTRACKLRNDMVKARFPIK